MVCHPLPPTPSTPSTPSTPGASLARACRLLALPLALFMMVLTPADAIFAQAGPFDAEQRADTMQIASALAAELAATDTAQLSTLLDEAVQVREGGAVLAVGREAALQWVATCTGTTFHLIGEAAVSASGATWSFQDSTDCYWRYRPQALRPRENVLPAEGLLTVHVRHGQVWQVQLTYSRDWERTLYNAQAAPIRIAQAEATVRASRAPALATATASADVHTSATAGAAAETSARPNRPHAPDTQTRTTPSVAPWAIAAALSTTVVLLAAFRKPVP